MAVTKLLDKLPNWTAFIVKRSMEGFRRRNFVRPNPDLSNILNRVMGDVYDWLVPTPNAL